MGSTTENITYCSDELVDFYSSHRRTWDEIYPSEKSIFEQLAHTSPHGLGTVLDVGCAAGGLCTALTGNLPLTSYTGVDIHAGLIQAATRCGDYGVPTEFLAGDVCCLPELADRTFDTVVSLGCADWNVRLTENITSCWNYVKPGGSFVITLRLIPGPSLTDPATSYQYACFDDSLPEDTCGLDKAPYMVLNQSHALELLTSLSPAPALIRAHGYWGTPSSMAVTPVDRVVFAAISLTKPANGAEEDETLLQSLLPASLFLTPKP